MADVKVHKEVTMIYNPYIKGVSYMVPDELKTIIGHLKEQGKMKFLEGATEEQIKLYEKENKIQLPEEYKEWLMFSDGGDCFLPAGVQFYGVSHKPYLDVDDDDRPEDKYVVIGALSNGDPILCEKNGKGISIYNHEAGVIEEDEKYTDFYAFLIDLPELLGIES